MNINTSEHDDNSEIVILGLGSNLGDKYFNLFTAIESLAKHKDITFKATSSIYESDAIDFESNCFNNLTIAISTTLSPINLLTVTQSIEINNGRNINKIGTRHKKYMARKIDIDILYYGNITLKTTRLIIPHPAINNRLFVLKPLLDIIFLLPSIGTVKKETIEHSVIKQRVQELKETSELLKTELKREQLLK
jgi:2-amino-4-hydroxy-6-hydroxymethyldihydropteridine diphosphokinase